MTIHFTFSARQKQAIHQVPILSPTLLIVRQGEKRVYTGQEQLSLMPEHATILPAGITPLMENLPDNGLYFADLFVPPRAWLLRFREQYGHLLPPLPMQHARFKTDLALEQALEACKARVASDEPWQLARLELAWAQALLELVRLTVASSFFIASNQPLADHLRDLINFAPSQDWQAEKLAHQLGMSSATLRRRLQAENTSFTNLLQEVRMARALGLVITTAQAISDIAAQCGYESLASFSQAFKRHFEISPSELRATQT
ncbi:MAG TPA: helix-turn-helix transcriptional regulator [Thiolinea sp.]|nr:helix-turn-helix transcriptional regulator [Thiolinea sp.]